MFLYYKVEKFNNSLYLSDVMFVQNENHMCWFPFVFYPSYQIFNKIGETKFHSKKSKKIFTKSKNIPIYPTCWSFISIKWRNWKNIYIIQFKNMLTSLQILIFSSWIHPHRKIEYFQICKFPYLVNFFASIKKLQMMKNEW